MSRSSRIDTVLVITCLLLSIQNSEQDIYVYKIVNDEYLPSYVQPRSYGTEIHLRNNVHIYPTPNPLSTQQRNPQKPVSKMPIAVQNQQRRAQNPPDQFYDSRDRVSYVSASADRNQVFPVSPVAYERTNVNLHGQRPTAASPHRSEPTRTQDTQTTVNVFTNDIFINNEYQQRKRITTENTVQHNTDVHDQVYTEKSATRKAPMHPDGGRSAETNASHTLRNKNNKVNDTSVTPGNAMVNVTLDERGSFEGACPSGDVRVNGICQKAD